MVLSCLPHIKRIPVARAGVFFIYSFPGRLFVSGRWMAEKKEKKKHLPQRRSSTSGNSFYKAFDKTVALSDRKPHRASYTPAAGEEFALRYAAGEDLMKLWNEPGMPGRTCYFFWKLKHPEFAEIMEAAEKVRAESYAVRLEHVSDTVDNYNSKSAKVRADILRHLAGAYNPDKFGARTKVVGDKNQPLAFTVVTGVPDPEEPIDCSTPVLTGPPEDKEGFEE